MANLLELYGHDFSEFLDLALGSDGKMGNHGVDHLGKVLGKHFKAAAPKEKHPKNQKDNDDLLIARPPGLNPAKTSPIILRDRVTQGDKTRQARQSGHHPRIGQLDP